MREIYVNKEEITEINGFLQKEVDGENNLIFLRVTNAELYQNLVENNNYTLRIPDVIIYRKKKTYNENKMDMLFYNCKIMAHNPKDMSIVYMNSYKNWLKINHVRKNRIKNLPE